MIWTTSEITLFLVETSIDQDTYRVPRLRSSFLILVRHLLAHLLIGSILCLKSKFTDSDSFLASLTPGEVSYAE